MSFVCMQCDEKLGSVPEGHAWAHCQTCGKHQHHTDGWVLQHCQICRTHFFIPPGCKSYIHCKHCDGHYGFKSPPEQDKICPCYKPCLVCKERFAPNELVSGHCSKCGYVPYAFATGKW